MKNSVNKRALALFMAMVLVLGGICPIEAFAQEMQTVAGAGERESVDYSWKEKEDGTVEITGGNYWVTTINIPETIEGKKVTSIGGSAFFFYSGLTEIKLPDSLTSIGDYAFSGCSGLTEIKLPDSLTSIGRDAFEYCRGLTEIKLPDSVTSIGSSAFSGCSGLTEIKLPDSVTSIGSGAFSGCSGLTEINVGDGNSKYASQAGILYNKEKTEVISCPKGITGIVQLADSVMSIGDYAFSSCRGLTEIKLPDSVTSIGKSAFEYCNGLSSITLPDSVTSIGECAFWGCEKLSGIELPDSVTSIGEWTFCDCSGLNSIKLPDSVTSIGECAFMDCEKLSGIELPDSVVSIGRRTFSGCSGLTEINVGAGNSKYTSQAGILYNKEKTEVISCPEGITGTIEIADGVTNINRDVFYRIKMKEIVVPGTVASIVYATFDCCTELETAVMKEGVKELNMSAFSNCDKLKQITIPRSVTAIRDIPEGNWTILCYGDSVAHQYALENDVPFRLIDGHGHTFGSQTQVVKAGMGKDGSTKGTCSVCGESCTNVIYAPATVALSKSSYTYNGKEQTPTVTVKDRMGNLLKEKTDYEVSYPQGRKNIGKYTVTIHFKGNYEGSVAKTFQIVAGNGTVFTSGTCRYRILNASTVAAAGLKNKKATKVSIPKTVAYGGVVYKVVAIADKAFCKTKIKAAVVGDNVKTIGKSAFEGCSKLEKASFGKNVEKIGKNTFKNCKKLKTITVKSSRLKSVGTGTFKGIHAKAAIKAPKKKLSAYKKIMKGKGQGKKVKIVKM